MLSHSYVVCYAQRYTTLHRAGSRATVQHSDHCLHCIVLLRWEQATLNALKLFSFSPLDLDLDRAGDRNIFF